MPFWNAFGILFPILVFIPEDVFAAVETGTDKNMILAEPLAASNIWQMVFGLVLVILIIFALSWLLRRVTGLHSVAGGSLKLIAGLSVGNRERIILIQVGEQQLLIGVAPGRVQTLHVLDKPVDTEPSSMTTNHGFAKSLFSAMETLKKNKS